MTDERDTPAVASEAVQQANMARIMGEGPAQPSGEAVPIDVEDDDTADDEPAVDPASAGESSGRWQPITDNEMWDRGRARPGLCACLGRPGCFCDPDGKPADGA